MYISILVLSIFGIWHLHKIWKTWLFIFLYTWSQQFVIVYLEVCFNFTPATVRWFRNEDKLFMCHSNLISIRVLQVVFPDFSKPVPDLIQVSKTQTSCSHVWSMSLTNSDHNWETSVHFKMSIVIGFKDESTQSAISKGQPKLSHALIFTSKDSFLKWKGFWRTDIQKNKSKQKQ